MRILLGALIIGMALPMTAWGFGVVSSTGESSSSGTASSQETDSSTGFQTLSFTKHGMDNGVSEEVSVAAASEAPETPAGPSKITGFSRPTLGTVSGAYESPSSAGGTSDSSASNAASTGSNFGNFEGLSGSQSVSQGMSLQQKDFQFGRVRRGPKGPGP